MRTKSFSKPSTSTYYTGGLKAAHNIYLLVAKAGCYLNGP